MQDVEGDGSHMAEAFGGVEAGKDGVGDGAGVPVEFGGWGGRPDDSGGLVHEAIADVCRKVGGDVVLWDGGCPRCFYTREEEQALGCG